MCLLSCALPAAAVALLGTALLLRHAASSILHEISHCGLQQHWQFSFVLPTITFSAGLPLLSATCNCVAQQRGGVHWPFAGHPSCIQNASQQVEGAAIAGGGR